MWRKITATMKKEALLMKRDLGGLLLLFLMPSLLIVVMALVQDAPFREFRHQKIDLLFSDEDEGSRLSQTLRQALDSSGHFQTIQTLNGLSLQEATMKAALQSGRYAMGIHIPKGAQAELVNAANQLTNRYSVPLGLGALPARSPRDEIQIKLYFDPTTKPTFRISAYQALDRYLSLAQTQYMLERMDQMVKSSTSIDSLPPFSAQRGVGLAEFPVKEPRVPGKHVHSVQHNVPAWTIFGMFFILIPIIAHSIKEREEGSAMRVRLIPGAPIPVLMAKIFFFTLFTTLQFWIMMGMGYTILPWLGLERLYLGDQPWALSGVALAIAFCASSIGFLFGNLFKTTNQGLPVGSISIVLMAAIGGIWVPIELFPPILHQLAKISPLYWSMEAINNLVIRDLPWSANWIPLGCLIGLGFIALLLSLLLERRRRFHP